LLGLTSRQADAAFNLRSLIQSKPGRRLKAGKVPIRVSKGGASVAFTERRVEQYSRRLLNQRALMIARTETMTAANEGQRQLWAQAQRQGLLAEDRLKEWIVTPDDRLCPICAPLQGETAPVGEPFPTTGKQAPPAHVMCRCAMGISAKRAGAPRETFPEMSTEEASRFVSTNYTGASYRDINGTLRQRRTSELTEKMGSAFQALAESTSQKKTLLRGMDGVHLGLEGDAWEALIGTEVTDAGFVSTARTLDPCKRAAVLADRGCFLRIRVPKGTKILDVDTMRRSLGLGASLEEEEILRGATFRIVGVIRDSWRGMPTLDVEILLGA